MVSPASPLVEELRELSGRVRRLEDESSILQLLYRYGHCIDPWFSVQGDRAQIDSYFVRVELHDGAPRVRSFGRYRDVVRRADAGWLIESRTVELEARL